MTTTQHTSGDWYVERIPRMMDKRPDEKDIWGVYSTRKTRYFDKPQNICFFDWGTPEGKANAHLIAAAPDLLSALIALEKASREVLDTSATHEGLKNCKILVEARIAIEKAGGEWK